MQREQWKGWKLTDLRTACGRQMRDACACAAVRLNYAFASCLLKQAASLELCLVYYFPFYLANLFAFAAMAFETISSTICHVTSVIADRQLGRGMVFNTLCRPALMAGRGRLGRAWFPVLPVTHVAVALLADERSREIIGVPLATSNYADRGCGQGMLGQARRTMSQRFCGNFGYRKLAALGCACALAERHSQQ